MAITQGHLFSSRLQQRQRKAAPPALSLGATKVSVPRRRVIHSRTVKSSRSSNMSRGDPPSPPPNPPPSPSMLIELDDGDFRI